MYLWGGNDWDSVLAGRGRVSFLNEFLASDRAFEGDCWWKSSYKQTGNGGVKKLALFKVRAGIKIHIRGLVLRKSCFLPFMLL